MVSDNRHKTLTVVTALLGLAVVVIAVFALADGRTGRPLASGSPQAQSRTAFYPEPSCPGVKIKVQPAANQTSFKVDEPIAVHVTMRHDGTEDCQYGYDSGFRIINSDLEIVWGMESHGHPDCGDPTCAESYMKSGEKHELDLQWTPAVQALSNSRDGIVAPPPGHYTFEYYQEFAPPPTAGERAVEQVNKVERYKPKGAGRFEFDLVA